jgi:hypothetical protein
MSSKSRRNPCAAIYPTPKMNTILRPNCISLASLALLRRLSYCLQPFRCASSNLHRSQVLQLGTLRSGPISTPSPTSQALFFPMKDLRFDAGVTLRPVDVPTDLHLAGTALAVPLSSSQNRIRSPLCLICVLVLGFHLYPRTRRASKE